MDRLSSFDRTAQRAGGTIADGDLRRHVARGRRLQREAIRGAFKDVGRLLRRGVSGWGDYRLSHPRSRVGC